MNDAGGTTAVGLTTEQGKMFWAQFSTWMATKTAGKFAFWLTGGTTDGFFPPCGKYPRCYFEVYELPYLQVSLTTLSCINHGISLIMYIFKCHWLSPLILATISKAVSLYTVSIAIANVMLL